MQIINWLDLNTRQQEELFSRSSFLQDQELSITVEEIINKVKSEGDKALFTYSQQFDGVNLESFAVSACEYAQIETLSKDAKQAILTAIDNISYYHKVSQPRDFEFERNNIKLGKLWRPINKVGLYIPGGSAPLVSTLLMLAIPAMLAGCPCKVLLTPPGKDGLINPAILFAAQACGINAIYKVGGAQAIAALAFGTKSIPKVDKIFGPGNKYVTEAKMQVSRSHLGAALDLPAGPSEVLIIADASANPAFIASDLLAQAEHDPAAQIMLLTASKVLASKVISQINQQITNLSRKTIINQVLARSIIIITDEIEDAFTISNRYAPEHLILQIENAEAFLNLVTNAGSVFIGKWSPESIGDYASGTNHVLPTYGYARTYSGLDVSAFMKAISYQNLSASGLQTLGPTVETLATLEGLDAHKNAVSVRLRYLEENQKWNG